MNALVPISTFEPLPQGYCLESAMESWRARRARWAASAPDPRMVEIQRLAEIDNRAFDRDAAWRRTEAAHAAAKHAAQLEMLAMRRARNLGPPIAAIQRVVADAFLVPVIHITSPRRTAHVVAARMVAVYLAHQITAKSLPELGRRFGGRDHTTILHSVRKMKARAAADPEFAVMLGLLRAEIEGDC